MRAQRRIERNERDGKDGPFLVTWLPDAEAIGSAGFGLLNELDRRGFDVRAEEPFRPGATRYHVIDGRQCWYAATSPAAKPGAAKPDAPEPIAAADETDVNPYGDPIWRQSGARTALRKPRRTKPSLSDSSCSASA